MRPPIASLLLAAALLLAAGRQAASHGDENLWAPAAEVEQEYTARRAGAFGPAAATAAAAAAAGPVYNDPACAPLLPKLAGGFDAALERFRQSIEFKTVSQAVYQSTCNAEDPKAFEAYRVWVETNYPEITTQGGADITWEKTGNCSLSWLLTWKGTDATLKPILFHAHIDVVPTDPDKYSAWKYKGPFNATVADGRIYGRGTADCKGHVQALLEMATVLKKEDWKPQRTLIFAFMHDEESAGLHGSNWTLNNVIKPRYPSGIEAVWDEGIGMIANARTQAVTALLSIAEKGQQFINVTVQPVGGHSSAAPNDGSLMSDILGRFFMNIFLTDPKDTAPQYVKAMVDQGMALFSKKDQTVIEKAMHAGAKTADAKYLNKANALFNLLSGAWTIDNVAKYNYRKDFMLEWVNSKRSVTLIGAGTSENTLPQMARISMNFRTLYPWTRETMEAYVNEVVAAAQNFKIKGKAFNDTSYFSLGPSNRGYGVAPQEGGKVDYPAYKFFKATIQSTMFQGNSSLPVIPGFMVGSTDSRHWAPYSRQDSLRFYPYALTAADAQRIHGDDEQVSVDSWKQGLCLTYRLIKGYATLPTLP